MNAIGTQIPGNSDVFPGEDVLSWITCFICLYNKLFLSIYIHIHSKQKISMIMSTWKNA